MSALIDFIFERQLTNVTFTEGYYMHLDVLAVMVSISEFVPTQHTDIGHKGGVHTATTGTADLTVHQVHTAVLEQHEDFTRVHCAHPSQNRLWSGRKCLHFSCCHVHLEGKTGALKQDNVVLQIRPAHRIQALVLHLQVWNVQCMKPQTW